ncbi:MAG: FtsQ-type POTRA domain-containing protein [Bdellovibrionales bacterium]|nr:FtsQ-type POTRA domain-containing protein [Bdellovibrionales bacterium]
MAKWSRKLLSGTAGFLIASTMGVGTYWAIQGPWFGIEQIEIEMDPVSGQDVLFQRIQGDLRKKYQLFNGKKLWEVSIQDLRSLAEKDSRVKRASVSRRFLDGILVQIRPRDPVLGLVDNRGRVYPVANDASLLPDLPPEEAPDLPYLRGSEFFKKSEMRSKAVSLIAQIPPQGLISVASISEIHFLPKEGFHFILRQKGIRVLIGDSIPRIKLSHVEQVLNYLTEHQIDGRVIDARFSKKVVVRLRNQP